MHNSIDIESGILCKGAVSAKKRQKLIIPINNKHSILCVGRGNPDWNYSAPIGDGTVIGIKEVKECLSFTSNQESEREVGMSEYSSSEVKSSSIEETLEVVGVLRSLYRLESKDWGGVLNVKNV
jgi:tRNA-splicing ligase RtcB (3'-phosphate/5'-hydroxy nucleic acid ligase)